MLAKDAALLDMEPVLQMITNCLTPQYHLLATQNHLLLTDIIFSLTAVYKQSLQSFGDGKKKAILIRCILLYFIYYSVVTKPVICENSLLG